LRACSRRQSSGVKRSKVKSAFATSLKVDNIYHLRLCKLYVIISFVVACGGDASLPRRVINVSHDVILSDAPVAIFPRVSYFTIKAVMCRQHVSLQDVPQKVNPCTE